MKNPLDGEGLDLLFREARSQNAWLDRPLGDELLRQLYDLMKWGSTSANCCPARTLFLRTPQAKERLRPLPSPGNVEKTMAAPVTAITGYDEQFYEKLPQLFPHNPAMRDLFAGSPEVAATEVPVTGSGRSNFLCNLGYGDPAALFPRSPRLDFDEACRLL